MPHIADESKVKLEETKRPIKEGDLCYLFANAALQEYNKEPRWSSIHKIRVAMNHPFHTEWSHLIIQTYMTGWSKVDIEAAANLAFDEFYAIVGRAYEDGMILQNGNAFKGAKIPSLGDNVTITDGKEVVEPTIHDNTELHISPVGFRPVHIPASSIPQAVDAEIVPTPKRRGRPVGSKNKPTEVA